MISLSEFYSDLNHPFIITLVTVLSLILHFCHMTILCHGGLIKESTFFVLAGICVCDIMLKLTSVVEHFGELLHYHYCKSYTGYTFTTFKVLTLFIQDFLFSMNQICTLQIGIIMLSLLMFKERIYEKFAKTWKSALGVMVLILMACFLFHGMSYYSTVRIQQMSEDEQCVGEYSIQKFEQFKVVFDDYSTLPKIVNFLLNFSLLGCNIAISVGLIKYYSDFKPTMDKNGICTIFMLIQLVTPNVLVEILNFYMDYVLPSNSTDQKFILTSIICYLRLILPLTHFPICLAYSNDYRIKAKVLLHLIRTKTPSMNGWIRTNDGWVEPSSERATVMEDGYSLPVVSNA